jgi:hypothetical protein
MVSYSRVMFSDKVDKHEVAKHWVRKNGVMLSNALKFHERNSHKTHFTDVDYAELVGDSVGVLDRIYLDRDEPIDDDLRKVLTEANARNPKGKYGKHHYSLDDFGIDEGFIDQYTREYQDFQRSIMNMSDKKINK